MNFEFANWQDIVNRLQTPLRLVLHAVLVICLIVLSVRLIWLVFAPGLQNLELSARALPGMVVDRQETAIDTVDRTILSRINPFTAEPMAVIEDAPETTLNLTLESAFVSSVEAAAYIRTADNRVQKFRVGDEIMSGVTLEEIVDTRKVILMRSGEREILAREGLGRAVRNIQDIEAERAQAAEEASSAQDTPLSIDEITIPDRFMLTLITPQPVERSGQLYGYMMTSAGGSDSLSTLGLMPGEVLIEVDGRSVSGFDSQELLAQFENRDRIDLLLERDETKRGLRWLIEK